MTDLVSYFRSGCPAIYIRTVEEERALEYLVNSLKKEGLEYLKIFIWKPTLGLYPYRSDPRYEVVYRGLSDTLYGLTVSKGPNGIASDCVYVFFRVHYYLDNPEIVQHIRDAAWAFRYAGSHLVFVGPHVDFPPELQEVLTIIDFDYPTRKELLDLIEKLISIYGNHLSEEPTEDTVLRAVEAARGMTVFRAESAVALSFAETGRLDVSVIHREKRRLLKHTEAVQFIECSETFDDLGGFPNLKKHVLSRKIYFDSYVKAERAGILSPPKGLFLVGLPGTGKTLSARCIANALGIPLYRLDVGSLFRSYVGESESATRRALKLIEAAAPVVLLLDEFEKAFSGLASSGHTDSGVTSRVISTLLSWMQECKAPVYKVATANSLRNLDAAMIRLGRWDAVFAVDLPQSHEREEILSIHLRRRGYDPSSFDLSILVSELSGFVGSEIEAVVEEAIYRAVSSDRFMDTSLLREVIGETVPISETDEEEIAIFRRWLTGRAAPA